MTENTVARTVSTHVVGAGDDAITYDIHGDLTEATVDRPALFLFAAPMDASGLALLAALMTDRPVVTYDPRGAGRNPVAPPTSRSSSTRPTCIASSRRWASAASMPSAPAVGR